MDRRIFTKTCLLCISGVMMPPLLTGCRSTYYTQGTIEPNGVSLLKSEFTYLKKEQLMTRQYIIVNNEKLTFPLYLYRFSDNDYSALLMRCTHKGATLSASGDHLHCPNHGSEFDNRGIVTEGPAEKNLPSFKVFTNDEKIFIDLRS